MSDSPLKQNRIGKRLDSSRIVTKLIPIEAIEDHHQNYNFHPEPQIAQLAKSNDEFGQYRSIVVWERPNGKYIRVVGHGYSEGARQNGETVLRCEVLPMDTPAETITAIMVADNLHAQNSEPNEEMLVTLLQEQQNAGYDLISMGSDDESLRQLLESLGDEYLGDEGEGEGEADDFDEEPDEEQTRVKLGDVWQLGEHRLLVGDCTDPENIEKLMQGEKAAITFTSPPYNAAKKSSLPNKDKYLHDEDSLEEGEYLSLLIAFTSLALKHSSYIFVNIQSLSGNKIPLIDYLYKFKAYYADTIIWDKQTAEPAMAKNVLNSQFEYVHVLSHKANRAIGTKEFRGTLSNVLSMNSRQDKEHSNIHKATFPLAFAQHFVEEFSGDNEIVLDPFCGSGTTLIACEKTGRVCYGCELEPTYANLILSRWEQLTGQQATLLDRVEEVVNV